MPTLRIFLLQNPTVEWDEKPFGIERRAVRNLLFYLACQPDADRASLINLFWPEVNDDYARRQFRFTLGKLRSSLPDHSLVIKSGDRWRLDESRVWVDVREFRALAEQYLHPALQISNQRPLPEALAQHLRRAAKLWSAEQFWPGADFYGQSELEGWLRDLRQEMEYAHLRILERLAYNAAANGDHELALMRARRALQLDPFNDEMHAQTFTWLVDSGQRSKALDYCQGMQELYDREGIPLPENLQQLCQTARLLSGQTQPAPSNPWPRSLINAGGFISRAEAVQTLRQAYQQGGRLLLEGEAGVGKTRLMYEAFRNLEPAPRLFLASGHVYEQNLPFQALINALRHQVLQSEWMALDRVWAAQLARLMPELTTLRPDLDEAANLSDGEPIFFEAVRHLALLLSTSQKLVLILDDAQWHDQVSLNALTYLCNHGFFNQHGLVVLAYRPEEVTPPLEKFIALNLPLMRNHHLRLERFSTEEVGLLTRRMLGYSPSPEVVERLMRETGGNPLFLQETLYLLLNHTPLEINQLGDNLPLSGNLQAVARDRLQRLNPLTRQVVGVAAVVGNEFMPALIESVGNLPAEQVVEALEELEQARLIQLAKNTTHRQVYTFVYSSIRDAVLLEMGTARQRMLHLRVARNLEKAHQQQPGAMSSTLAEHYESAGEFSTALHHWIDAGKHALNFASPNQAQMSFRRAEGLLQQLGSVVPDSEVYTLYHEWNTAVTTSGDAELQHQMNLRFLEVGEKRMSPWLCGAALNGLARAALFAYQIRQALQYCERAAFHLGQVNDLYELIETSNLRGDCLILLDQFQPAVEAFSNSLEFSSAHPDPRLLDGQAHAEYSLSEAYLAMGQPALAHDYALRCVRTSTQTKNVNWAMKAHMLLVLSEYYLGNMSEALDHARQGAKLAESLQSWRNLAYIHLAEARVELAMGRIDAGWLHSQSAEEIGSAEKISRVLSWAASHRGQTLRFLRQYPQAVEAYQAAAAHSQFTLDRLECQFRMGLAQAGAGQREDGLSGLQACLNAAQKAHLDFIELLAATAILFIQVQNGMLEQSRERLASLAERASGRGIAEVDCGIIYTRAWLAQHDGLPEEAHAHTRQLIEMSAHFGILWWELTGWLFLGRLGQITPADRARIAHLAGVVSEHGKNIPELAGFTREFLGWLNGELGYT